MHARHEQQAQQKPTQRRLTRKELHRRLAETNTALQMAMEKMKALQGLAYTDALTGLTNRRGFDERLEQELSRASRRADRMFSLLVIDLDGFKGINDTQGHAAGDAALVRVARFLTAHLRTHDVVARTGGDEFMVLLPDTDATACDAAVARLRTALAAFDVACSVGSASWPGDGHTLAGLSHAADQAMYAEKRARRPASSESRVA